MRASRGCQFSWPSFISLMATVAILGLSSCGKSADDRRYEAAECATYFLSLDQNGANLTNVPIPMAFLQALDQVESGLQHKGGDMEAAGTDALANDAAKSAAAQQDAINLFETQAQNNDISGATNFMNDCEDNYNKLTNQ